MERFLSAEQLVARIGEGDNSKAMAKMISNNVAVCLLYVGRLKEGLQRLERDITQDPSDIQVHTILQ